MTGLSPLLILLVLIAAVVGAASVIFTPIWAIPIGVVAIAGVLGWEALKRQRSAAGKMEQLREDASSDVEFTERDKQTLA